MHNTDSTISMAFTGRLLSSLKLLINNFENEIYRALFGHNFPQASFAVAGPSGYLPVENYNLLDDLKTGILWAVPKSRRTIQKRRNRLFGVPEYVWKPLVPKTNILCCRTCGHNHEAGHLCPNCYDKVKKETEAMQEAIEAQLKLGPHDKEVIVLYEGETRSQSEEFWKGKRIVELKKKRPSWFSKNLLQKSTQEAPPTKDVKPTELA